MRCPNIFTPCDIANCFNNLYFLIFILFKKAFLKDYLFIYVGAKRERELRGSIVSMTIQVSSLLASVLTKSFDKLLELSIDNEQF